MEQEIEAKSTQLVSDLRTLGRRMSASDESELLVCGIRDPGRIRDVASFFAFFFPDRALSGLLGLKSPTRSTRSPNGAGPPRHSRIDQSGRKEHKEATDSRGNRFRSEDLYVAAPA